MSLDGVELIEVAAGAYSLGEGPLWHEEMRRLVWTDIDAGRVHAMSVMDESPLTLYEGAKVGGMTLQRDGALLLFRERDVARLDADGAVRSLFDVDEPQTERFNDVLALEDGSVLAGMVGKDEESGGLFHVGVDGSMRLLFRNTKYPNGMAVTRDGQTLYYTCSTRGVIVRFDLSALLASEPESAWDLAEVVWRCTRGTPDGLTMDAEGRLWSASWGGGRVVRLSTDGEELGEIGLRERNVTSCCFAGDGLGMLAITTAGGGVYACDVGVRGIRGVRGVRGVAEHRSAILG